MLLFLHFFECFLPFFKRFFALFYILFSYFHGYIKNAPPLRIRPCGGAPEGPLHPCGAAGGPSKRAFARAAKPLQRKVQRLEAWLSRGSTTVLFRFAHKTAACSECIRYFIQSKAYCVFFFTLAKVFGIISIMIYLRG